MCFQTVGGNPMVTQGQHAKAKHMEPTDTWTQVLEVWDDSANHCTIIPPETLHTKIKLYHILIRHYVYKLTVTDMSYLWKKECEGIVLIGRVTDGCQLASVVSIDYSKNCAYPQIYAKIMQSHEWMCENVSRSLRAALHSHLVRVSLWHREHVI